MKSVVYLDPAAKALRKHRNMASRIMTKIDAYAADPAAFANLVTPLRGLAGKRMRIGDFRVLFEETATEIVVSDIGPRGSPRGPGWMRLGLIEAPLANLVYHKIIKASKARASASLKHITAVGEAARAQNRRRTPWAPRFL